MVNQNPPNLQLNKANTLDTQASFLDLHLSNGFVSSKIYDKRDYFGLNIFIAHQKKHMNIHDIQSIDRIRTEALKHL